MGRQIIPVLAEFRRRLEELYASRLVTLVLFGSYAREEAEPASDIDVLVVLRETVNPGEEIARTGEIVSALSLQYDLVLSCTFVSHDRYLQEQSPLLLNARREGVEV